MKVLGISGSPRKNGNTEAFTRYTLDAIGEEGLETELLSLAGLDIRPCSGCLACTRGGMCPMKDDFLSVYDKMKYPEGLILATPVYYGSATALLKALIERAGYISRNHGEPFKGKVGGPLVVARRAGHNFTIAQLTLWFQILGMVVPGSTYWNVAFGRNPGDLENDEEGLRTARNFGKNIAWVVKKLHG